MKKIIYTTLCLVALTCISCNDWFDVTADSEVREKDHYSTATGFQQSLIGCYIGMTDDALYGTNLSWFGPELMAHQFNPVEFTGPTSISYMFQQHLYKHSNIVPTIEGIWAKAYNVIANANKALANIDTKKEELDDFNYHVIKGELLAIRAYMHFDLLRLYGYGNWVNRQSELNAKVTIPYVTTVDKNPTPQQSGTETIKLLLQDLTQAADLLKDYDPITKKQEASAYSKYNEEGFFKERTLRMNYYAVKALQARVYMWQGGNENLEKALSAAEEVITAVGENGIRMSDMSTSCYFTTPDNINVSRTSLSNEFIFGLNVSDVASRTVVFINVGYKESDSQAMFIDPENAEELYEHSAMDIRIINLLSLNTSINKKGYVPLKVVQGNLAPGYKDRISMIRLPELYYMAAECYATKASPNLSLALERLNTVREKRGLYTPLQDLDANGIIEEIKKEYKKEFISEGVIFYYYKRTGATTIPFLSDEMGDAQYVLPYPEFELQSGRVQ